MTTPVDIDTKASRLIGQLLGRGVIADPGQGTIYIASKDGGFAYIFGTVDSACWVGDVCTEEWETVYGNAIETGTPDSCIEPETIAKSIACAIKEFEGSIP